MVIRLAVLPPKGGREKCLEAPNTPLLFMKNEGILTARGWFPFARYGQPF